jgi:tryptophan synthase alpha subunit
MPSTKGELQEIARGIAGAPCRRRHGTSEAAGFEGECVDKGIEAADGIVLGNAVVEALGEAEHFVAVRALDMAH